MFSKVSVRFTYFVLLFVQKNKSHNHNLVRKWVPKNISNYKVDKIP